MFTAADPLVGSALMAILCLALLLTTPPKKTSNVLEVVHRTLCLLGAVLLLFVSWVHFRNHAFYETHYAYHESHWRYAIIINLFGTASLLAKTLQGMTMKRVILISVSMVLVSSLAAAMYTLTDTDDGAANKAEDVPGHCSDAPFFAAVPSGQAPPSLPVSPVEHFQHSSSYLAMSDGVKLAADVYLPHDYDPVTSKPLPTFLHLTRYHRAEKRSLWTKFLVLFGHAPNPEASFPLRSLHYLKTFVGGQEGGGYAFVSVDVRGTGASFGTRPLDLIAREVQDFAEVSQWTREQSFCNGRIGTGGISYDGITGALMAAQGGIDAAALFFAPGDIFEDIAFVGGIPTIGFVDWYGRFTKASENNEPVNDVDNELPAFFKVLSNWGFCGVAPVYGEEDLLDSAVAEHAKNFDMETKVRDPTVLTKDSTLVTTSDGEAHTVRSMGISTETYQALVDQNVAVYSVAGYYDSGSVRSSARLHNYMLRHGGNSKFTIGPWTHGCRACWTPTKGAEATKTQYPLFDDMKRFFDCQLKDECGPSEAKEELPLHYYLSGDDRWHASQDEWPPTGLHEIDFLLATMDVMANDAVTSVNENAIVSYKVNFITSTGLVSRWNLVHHLMKKQVTYPNRGPESSSSLIFESHIGASDIDLVGSPLIELSLALIDGSDAAIFAYLEVLDGNDGKIKYITEGALRVSHRETPAGDQGETRVGAFDRLSRSFSDDDMRKLTPEEFTAIRFVMEPIAYRIPAKSRIRLVLAGADKDNFYIENISDIAKNWKIDTRHSKMSLPIMASHSA